MTSRSATKLHVADPGLLAARLRADARRVRDDHGLAGALFETFVTTEIEPQASWSSEPLSLWHYREREREVHDIVARAAGDVLAMEVQASGTVPADDLRGFTHLREHIGSPLILGMVLYAGERTLPFGDRLWALPLQALWTP